MSLFDLILEGVENSVEAGASHISVLLDEKDGICSVSISDDGLFTFQGDPFEEGATEKGKGRGYGLFNIKRQAKSCSIERKDPYTILSFSGDWEEERPLSGALLPLFLLGADISLTIKRDGRNVTLSTVELRRADAYPDRAGAIGRFRSMVRQIEGDIYG